MMLTAFLYDAASVSDAPPNLWTSTTGLLALIFKAKFVPRSDTHGALLRSARQSGWQNG
jgi:hypothetical protein